MEPIVGLYAGLHIDGGANILTGDALKPHVQDALDEIEYITGPTTTTWGARRAKDGHPRPFKLRYVEIGNEDWLNRGTASYPERFAMFYDAIRAKYPDIKIISSMRSQDVARNVVHTRPPDREVLTGADTDINTVAEPRKVVPQPVRVGPIKDAGAVFASELPARSVTVLRVKTR